ncbi:MAG: hypothetical protein VZR11_10720, partial [Succinimonas sp.]|nr:hypothetical protein [Succinimonas sp.]
LVRITIVFFGLSIASISLGIAISYLLELRIAQLYHKMTNCAIPLLKKIIKIFDIGGLKPCKREKILNRENRISECHDTTKRHVV